jgi:hypothetical protein
MPGFSSLLNILVRHKAEFPRFTERLSKNAISLSQQEKCGSLGFQVVDRLDFDTALILDRGSGG